MANNKVTKILGYGALAVVVVGGGAFLVLSHSKPGLPGEVGSAAALVSQGEYVARVADCGSCHTAINGKVYAGGLQIKSPIGAIYSSNITPDKEHGIGNYSLADFDRAVRQGVRKDGASLYPAMPYPSFARLSDQDITALYAYFMHGVDADASADKPEDIPWPLSMRWPLAMWRGLFGPEPANAAKSVVAADPIVARGEYLVTGPGHCGACHTPRGPALQERALDNRSPAFLAGGTVIDGWIVPSLRGEEDVGLGRWSVDDIATFLKTGRTNHAAVFGGMADVVAWSTQYASDADLHAVGAYLKTLQPGTPGSARFVADNATAKLLDAGQTQGNHGAEVYQQQCAICHQNDGGGVARMFPPLAGNPVVTSANPVSVLHVVALGGALPPSNTAPSSVAMPGFAERLSERDLADVVNYIRTSWGNHAPANATADMVKPWRRVQAEARGVDTSGWELAAPQPYGSGWSFAPQSHDGHDNPQ